MTLSKCNVKLTWFLVLMALLWYNGAQPEEISWIKKSADMQIKVTCRSLKLALPVFLLQIAQQKKSQTKLQALTDVLDSVLQLHSG